MQPEAIVAATLAVSQERKSFTTNHTSVLKIVRFNAQKWLSSMHNAATLKVFVGQTNIHTHTHTHKATTVTLAAHAHQGLINTCVFIIYGVTVPVAAEVKTEILTCAEVTYFNKTCRKNAAC